MDKQLLLAWSKLYTLKLLFFAACVGPKREAMGGEFLTVITCMRE